MNKCFYTYLNPILFILSLLYFSRGRIFFFSKFSRILLFLYSGHREFLKTGYLKTLPVILGQSCPLSADLCGVFVHANKFLLPPFSFSPLGDILVMGKR